jgi:hypothetical protein
MSSGGRGEAETRPTEGAGVLKSMLAAHSAANPARSLPLDLDKAGQRELEFLLAQTTERLHLIEDASRRRAAAGSGPHRFPVTVVISQRPR